MATACFSTFTLQYHRKPHFQITATATSKQPTASPPSTNLPLKKIPGDYGLPIIGPINDRLQYFYYQGRDDFFRSRIQRHNSTVFRVNMPPGPCLAKDPKVIALLDAASFPVIFDTSLVDKRDLFTGTYMPSTDLTGGYRVLSYLDPSEPKHAVLKKLLFYMLSSRRSEIIPQFRTTFGELFQSLETDIAKKGKADFGEVNDQACFNFLVRSLLGKDPLESRLGSDGPKLILKWVLIQLSPLLTLGLPNLLEDLLLHSVRLPSAIVKADYQKLTNFFRDASKSLLDEAEKMGISRDEALHNIIFAISFNSFGGMKFLFPNIIKWVGRGGARLHGKLAEEIRTAVKSNNGELTMRAMEAMPLMKSVVYECLRIEPPVPLQYGRAKKDIIVKSHDVAFEVKSGEMLFGYQPFATKDPRVFERAEEFVGDRFVGEKGEELLKYVIWSNGPENETSTLENKQCAGKDFVVLVARMLVVELFLRYDTFDVMVGSSALGSSVELTAVRRATF